MRGVPGPLGTAVVGRSVGEGDVPPGARLAAIEVVEPADGTALLLNLACGEPHPEANIRTRLDADATRIHLDRIVYLAHASPPVRRVNDVVTSRQYRLVPRVGSR